MTKELDEYWNAKVILDEVKYLLKLKSYDDIIPTIKKLQINIIELNELIEKIIESSQK